VDLDPTRLFNAYLSARDRDARYSSFDYCYNYFQSFRKTARLNDSLLRTHSKSLAYMSPSFLQAGECSGAPGTSIRGASGDSCLS
jgi:hypothetical protein